MKKKITRGKLVKRNKTRTPILPDEINAPRSFVVHHGPVTASLKSLCSDLRRVMKPHTAEKIRVSRKVAMTNYVDVALPLKVTHLLRLSQTGEHITFKIGRFPQGPTISFEVIEYTLMKDVISSQKRALLSKSLFLESPCLMTNIQPDEGEKHLQLCSKMFLDMFPSIEPTKVKTKQIKRCFLINYDEAKEVFDLRQYVIRTKPSGVSKAMKKMLSSKIPNLNKYKDISDFVTKSELLSDSEGEDYPNSQVTVEKRDKSAERKQLSTVRLSEIGPRLTLKLIKIENGLCEGTVLYHSYRHKTAAEVLVIQKNLTSKRNLAMKRKKELQEKQKLKAEKKENHREKCLKGMGIDPDYRVDEVEDDDREYYREAIGQEPEEDTFKDEPKKSKYLKRSYKNK